MRKELVAHIALHHGAHGVATIVEIGLDRGFHQCQEDHQRTGAQDARHGNRQVPLQDLAGDVPDGQGKDQRNGGGGARGQHHGKKGPAVRAVVGDKATQPEVQGSLLTGRADISRASEPRQCGRYRPRAAARVASPCEAGRRSLATPASLVQPGSRAARPPGPGVRAGRTGRPRTPKGARPPQPPTRVRLRRAQACPQRSSRPVPSWPPGSGRYRPARHRYSPSTCRFSCTAGTYSRQNS